MLHDLPLDVELKYPGVPFFDPEIVLPKIQSLFNTDLLYFNDPVPIPTANEIKNNSGNDINRQISNSGSNKKGSTSGCLGLVVLFIVTTFIIACSI